MVNGKKQTQNIPKEMIEDVKERVASGRKFQDAVREVLAANAQLLVLARQQEKKRKKRNDERSDATSLVVLCDAASSTPALS